MKSIVARSFDRAALESAASAMCPQLDTEKKSGTANAQRQTAIKDNQYPEKYRTFAAAIRLAFRGDNACAESFVDYDEKYHWQANEDHRTEEQREKDLLHGNSPSLPGLKFLNRHFPFALG